MTSHSGFSPVRLAASALVAGGLTALTACSTQTSSLLSEKVDYRSKATQNAALDVPPDLTQLAREGRYAPRGGVVTASDLQQSAGNAQQQALSAAGANAVAPTSVGSVQLMRDGQTRWLSTTLPPEQVFPQLRRFWSNQGFVIDVDNPQTGVIETDWAENRAKLPQDVIRQAVGKVFDSLYSTGERDRFRTRIERRANGGTDIYIVHRGMVEVYDSQLKDSTVWQPRPRDPQLEAEFLSRIMIDMGKPAADARAQAGLTDQPSAPAADGMAPLPAAPIALPDRAELRIAEPFDRAWRRVSLALDRNGFTVEDRDRSAGLFFVRYVDLQTAREERNFFQRLFDDDKAVRFTRYQIRVKPETGDQATLVTVLNSAGDFDNSDAARRITGRLNQALQR